MDLRRLKASRKCCFSLSGKNFPPAAIVKFSTRGLDRCEMLLVSDGFKRDVRESKDRSPQKKRSLEAPFCNIDSVSV